MSDSLRVLSKADKNIPRKQSTARYVESAIPFAPEYSTFDIQISARATFEDIAYAKDDQLRMDIRRGNTLIAKKVPFDSQCHDPQIKLAVKDQPEYALEDATWLRRGLQKFFDCYYEYLKHGDLSQGSFVKGSYKIQFTGKERYKGDIRGVLFHELEDAMLADCSVDMYKLLKANGENAQVSFCPQLDAWAISSKNVCMLARSPDDFAQYESGGRFHFVQLIAQAWFTHLNAMDPALQQELKGELAGHTIVGEYVGNQEHQHLVKYNEIMILFYALVQNDSSATCCPPLQAYSMFNKYGLKFVPGSKVGTYNNVTDFYAEMTNQFRTTAQEDIESGEEGCVLYFVRNPIAGNEILASAEAAFLGNTSEEFAYSRVELMNLLAEQFVFSLCKLKTLEYRLFRKLREKLKSTDTDNKAKKLALFTKEMEQLVEDRELPKPAGYYKALAAMAMDQVCTDPAAKAHAASHYIDFLTEIQAQVENSQLPE